MGFGSAIHNSLMEIHREYLDGTPIDKTGCKTVVLKHVNFPYATDTVKESMTEKANSSVIFYYDNNAAAFNEIEYAEQDIQLDLGDGIIVTGKMGSYQKKETGWHRRKKPSLILRVPKMRKRIMPQ
jgi:DNA helicase-2/ATP-dependent DNA helicase PcrA